MGGALPRSAAGGRCQVGRARSLERDVVHATAMLVLHDRALREARADVDERIVAVVEPDTAELELGR